MLKIQDEAGNTVFIIKDDASSPVKVCQHGVTLDKVCNICITMTINTSPKEDEK